MNSLISLNRGTLHYYFVCLGSTYTTIVQQYQIKIKYFSKTGQNGLYSFNNFTK